VYGWVVITEHGPASPAPKSEQIVDVAVVVVVIIVVVVVGVQLLCCHRLLDGGLDPL